ncbi:unnamed protein product [Phyllotreta striolata]|uniref:Uncharacterized protein n=1 Tax=Phyllotreta striolata TaxID=444603 RepID=A0A9N9TPS0_PHYSR|nr:unnamed protein product [Phyllotreta striolata]
MKPKMVIITVSLFYLIGVEPLTENSSQAKIVRQIFDILSDASKYIYGYETENQIFVEEQGYKNNDNFIKEGQYQYTSPDGEIIRTVYTADEDGFHPQGSHLPTAPPLPPASFSFSSLSNKLNK